MFVAIFEKTMTNLLHTETSSMERLWFYVGRNYFEKAMINFLHSHCHVTHSDANSVSVSIIYLFFYCANMRISHAFYIIQQSKMSLSR